MGTYAPLVQVIVPFTEIQPATKQALDASGWPWESRYVGESDESYWGLLSVLWRGGEDFAIVEHDIVVGRDTLALFEACPQPWCAAPYSFIGMQEYAGLGCTRFRSEVMAKVPGLMDEVALMGGDSVHPHKHWCSIDAFMQVQLRAHGVVMCQHPRVLHLHDWPSHGCIPRPVTAS